MLREITIFNGLSFSGFHVPHLKTNDEDGPQ